MVFQDSESARKAGAAGNETKRRRKEMTPAQRAREDIQSKVPALLKELLQAAEGKGDFDKLSPAMRLRAIMRALEYGIGRPAPVSGKAKVPDPGDPEDGDAEDDDFEVT